MRLDKLEGDYPGFMHYMITGRIRQARRGIVIAVADGMPRAYVAKMILDARRKIRGDLARVERKRLKAAKR